MARKVFSSHIDEVSYDAPTLKFTIKWSSGKTSEYSGVPPDVAEKINASASIGTAVHQLLKSGGYDHTYSDDGEI
jgi:KTSC domain